MIQGERRRDDARWFEITQDIGVMKDQHKELRRAVDMNTEITTTIKENTEEIIDFFKAGKGFFKTMGYLGKIAKWITAVAAAVGVVWAAVHFGDPK